MTSATRASIPGRWRLAGAVVLILLLAAGAVPRVRAKQRAQALAASSSVSTVQVLHPMDPAPVATSSVPGTLQGWAEAAIRARSSGYVAAWRADIGSRVKAGELLALLVAPELEAALSQARSDVATAQANLDIASATAQRWQEMLRQKVTSQQEADQKSADLHARRAELSAAKANEARLAQSVAYTRITAPFDGIITARNVDIGSLVDAQASLELFHEVQSARLRAFAFVPDADAASVRPGMKATLLWKGQHRDAEVARTAEALDPGSRMLRIELDVANEDGALLPGQFVTVALKSVNRVSGSLVPVECVLYRGSGPQIALVDAQGRISLRVVTVQQDLGTQLIVAPALPHEARIVANPSDSISDGEQVRVVAPSARSTT